MNDNFDVSKWKKQQIWEEISLKENSSVGNVYDFLLEYFEKSNPDLAEAFKADKKEITRIIINAISKGTYNESLDEITVNRPSSFTTTDELESLIKKIFPESEKYYPIVSPYFSDLDKPLKITFKETRSVDKELFSKIVNFLKEEGFKITKESNFFDEDDDRRKMYPYIEFSK